MIQVQGQGEGEGKGQGQGIGTDGSKYASRTERRTIGDMKLMEY